MNFNTCLGLFLIGIALIIIVGAVVYWAISTWGAVGMFGLTLSCLMAGLLLVIFGKGDTP